MRFYKVDSENIGLDTTGIKILLMFHTENHIYVICDGEGFSDWQEITQTDFESIGGVVPIVEPIPETTEQKLARLEDQNIILMDALATTFEEVMALRTFVEGGTV